MVLPAAADDILFNVVTTVVLYLYDYEENIYLYNSHQVLDLDSQFNQLCLMFP